MYSSVNSLHRLVGVELEEEDVVVLALDAFWALGEVARRADRHDAVAVYCPRAVLRRPRVRCVGLFQPVRDDRLASSDSLVALVPGVEPVHGVLAEERTDRRLVVGSPRVDVVRQPLRHCRVVHGDRLTGRRCAH